MAHHTCCPLADCPYLMEHGTVCDGSSGEAKNSRRPGDISKHKTTQTASVAASGAPQTAARSSRGATFRREIKRPLYCPCGPGHHEGHAAELLLKQRVNPSWLQGLWKLGRADGPGRYKWRNRNEYDGEWKNGKMHGQGTLKWGSGERYDGEWKEGEEDGLGVFTWLDGSSYDGFWQHGRKHGIGVSRGSILLVMEHIMPEEPA